MSTITITLDDNQLARFEAPARLLGLPREEVARISIQEFLTRSDEEFDAIIEEIIAERGAVLRRLAQ